MSDIIGAMLPWAWHEESDDSKHGEGISRPRPGAHTREYRVLVRKAYAQPMVWITQAETKRHALRYAQNRWPGAAVEVMS
jgi:hypothetical protein